MKKEMFNRELSYIKNERYRENAGILLELLPDYFFEVPASSTGKYHPSFSLGEGGLVRHTKAAVRIAYDLLCNNSIGYVFKPEEKDLILFCLLIHDGLKSGLIKQKYTQVNHPILICDYLREKEKDLTLEKSEIEFICNIIETHMGEWNTDFNGNEVLKKPSNKYQKFVHMCDFLSSKKYLDIKFENNDIVE